MSETGLALTVLAWLAYFVSRMLQKRRLPELVAFLLVGALLGPSALGLIDDAGLLGLQPFTQLALAVLMFMIGERVSLRALRAASWVAPAAMLQFIACGGLVYLAVRVAGADDATALLLAVLAGAGAPMTVAAVVSSTQASGPYGRALVGAHAAADALAALAFALALPTAAILVTGSGGIGGVALSFARLGIGAAALGVVLGWIVGRFSARIDTSGELLLFALVHVLVASALSTLLDLSLPLAALVMGAVAATVGPQESGQRLFVAVRAIEQPLYLLFFGLAGASIHLDAVPSLGAIGAAYVAARFLGKMVGSLGAGLLTSLPARRAGALGLDLVPQAGVAVGLAVLAAEELPGVGADVATVVLGSVVLFELVGPLLVTRSLRRDGGAEPAADASTAGEELPQVVLVSCGGTLAVPAWISQWCGRVGATVCVLGPGSDPAEVTRISEEMSAALVPFRWLPLDGRDLGAATVDAAKELGADLVVLVPAAGALRRTHSRILRRLECPVLVMRPGPVEAVSDGASLRAAV